MTETPEKDELEKKPDEEDPTPGAGDPEHHHPENGEIDEALEETFPASDPPAF